VRAEHTLELVARDWLAHRAPAWTDKTQLTISRSLENDVFPELGSRPIAEITPTEIRKAVQRIEARGAGETASRVFQRLQSVFRFAVAHELVLTDPTYPMKPSEILKPREVTHRAAITEREAPEFLRKLDAYEGDPATRCALQLLMLTAVRPGKIRSAAWLEFDLEAGVWTIRPSG
jgi:integrase